MKIVKVIDEYNYVIDQGSINGIKSGDKFLVYLPGDEVFDPDTKKSLGRLEIPKDRCEIVHIQENMTIIKSVNAKNETGLFQASAITSILSTDSSIGSILSKDKRKVVIGDGVKKI